MLATPLSLDTSPAAKPRTGGVALGHGGALCKAGGGHLVPNE